LAYPPNVFRISDSIPSVLHNFSDFPATALFDLLHLLEDPLLGLVVGAIGTIFTLLGIHIAARAQRRSTEQIQEMQRSLTATFAHAFADEQGAEGDGLHPLHARAGNATSLPDTRASRRAESPVATASETAMPETADQTFDVVASGKLAGTADLTTNGNSDLLLEHTAPGSGTLKIFTWADFDLVLAAELKNNTGAHFVIDSTEPQTVATLNRADGRLVEDIWLWRGDRLAKQDSKAPRDPSRFAVTPSWSA
jgi:hypothetical protein